MQDNPDEPSPWGSPGASPRHTRPPTFNSLAGDPSQTPFGYESNNDSSAVSRADTDDLEDDGFRDSGAAETRPDDVFYEQKARSDETRDIPPGQPSVQQPPPEPPQKSPEQEQAAAEGQPAKPAAPQPRLQAKVTGLERTGKKDPILRFDIHVCLILSESCRYVIANNCRRTSPGSGPLSTATSAGSTPSSSSWQSTSYPPTQRPSSPPCLLP